MKLDQESMVFLTGGSGYIGRNIIRALVSRNVIVKALARSDESAKTVELLGAIPARGDLLDDEALSRGMDGTTHLIHAAADTSHGATSLNQNHTNIQGTRNVYFSAKKNGVKRALHISSEAVLLDGSPLIEADETHAMPTNFAGGYSKSKAESEKIALAQSSQNFEVVVIRPRFVWGLGDTTAMPQLLAAAKSGKLAWIDGGRYKTSTTNIENVVAGAILGLERGRTGQIYFISDGAPVIFRDFITKLLATQGVSAPSKEIPRWLALMVVRLCSVLTALSGGRISGPMSRQEYATLGVEVTLSIDKAKRHLDYQPVLTVDEGLALLSFEKAENKISLLPEGTTDIR